MTTAERTSTTDPYPTRADRPAMIPRVEATVWSDMTMPPAGPLTKEQLQAFDRDGYIFLEQVFRPDEVEALQAELKRLVEDPSRKDDIRTIMEADASAVRSIFEIHKSSDVLKKLAQDPRVAGAARQIVGSDVYIHQSRINVKPPMFGKGFFWHSDFETWHAEDGMPEMRCVSASIALTPNNEFNGPLMVVPGSHKTFIACSGATPDDNYQQSLVMQQAGTPDLDSLKTVVDQGGIVAPKGAAGGVVLFDCNIMHASTENLSPYPRSNAFFVYNSLDNTLHDPYAADKPRPDYIADREFTPLDKL